MITPLSMPSKKTSVAHARSMGMICCGNPVLVVTGTTQTITSLWALPPFTLTNEFLETMKVIMMDTTIVTPAQQAALEIVMIA